MSFAYEKTGETVVGNLRMTYGTFSGAAAAGSDIKTGLTNVKIFDITGADAVSVTGGTATVSSGSVDAGYWWAMGW